MDTAVIIELFAAMVGAALGSLLTYLILSALKSRYARDRDDDDDDDGEADVESERKAARAPDQCPVANCRIKRPHSHTDDLIRRIKGQ